MHISLLQFIITFAGVVFFFFSIDLYKRRKATLLHFFVFFGWGVIVMFFIRNPTLLNKFWNIFWLTRWADLIVYSSIIALAYFYIELLNSYTKHKQQLTKFTSFLACDTARETQKESVLSFLHNETNNYSKNRSLEKTSKKDFLIHIRCYNEETTIGWVIDKIIINWYHKILILNDGSIDQTLKIIQQKQKQYSQHLILIVSHTINRGPWSINQTWFEFCKRYWELLQIKWITMFDADDQMNIQDMNIFIEKIKKHKKIQAWFGSRFMWIKANKMPFFRKLVLKVWKIVSFILYKNKIEDYHCWFRVINLEVIKKIKLTADWFHYANELIDEINRLNIQVKEIPVHITYTEYSLWKWQKTSNAFKMWIEMIYRKFFFR